MAGGCALFDLIEPNFTAAEDVRWTSTSKYPVCGADGSVIGMVAEGHVIDSRFERRTAYEYDLRSVVELSSDAYGALICDINDNQIIELHSRGEWKTPLFVGMSWTELLAYVGAHVRRGDGAEELFASAGYRNLISMYRNNQRACDVEYFWEDGAHSHWVRNDIRIFTNPNTGHLLVASVLHNIGEEHAARDELVRQAYRDALTGLLNREETVKRIRAALQRAQLGSLFMLDIDNFKRVNDTFGHPAGDELLAGIGRILSGAFRSRDIVGRVGGDEFMVYACDFTDPDAAGHKGEEILRQIEKLQVSVPGCKTTASAGIARFSGCESFEQLYSRADAMLYRSKKSGKRRVVAEKSEKA